ncbi:class I adenylate-forming enzyme family protein [Cryptosporangium aurantiacum]|uniref:2-succinylbenzoyl-CoA synthetase n=1 Tax=Cryptosporangium aurantiacum TaxID=134849 RepID=A0A1M7R4J3_9ACTN|nr:AMP-binding protein [Cryptosporangium aurantiacum]SHN39974.1 2-succinylbenzoyl-CoA synthetase [Cryptosporangium aurantiacum]
MKLNILLDMAVDGFGDRVVVGSRRDGLTAARLRQLAAGGAAVVRKADADAIVYLAVNGPAFQVALFSAAYAGVPLVPLNYRLGQEQIDALLANHPRALAIVDESATGAVAESGLACRTPEEWIAAAAESGDAEPEEAESAAPAVIIYTSGTTSAPKGVLLRHENLVSYVLGTVEFADADADDAALMSVPPYHVAAVSNALTNLYAGRRVLVLENFTPERWLELVREERVTNAMVVPTMLGRIMDCAGVDRSVPSLRSLAYGGAKMPTRVIERALREWPHVDFVNAYGLTETSSTVTVLGPEDHRTALADDDPAIRARLASAGRAVPGIEIEIRDEEDRPVPPGTPGLIWIRGDQVSGEYAGQGPSVDARGFFFTRDQGRLDSDGYLFVEGRVDDTIIRGAENIAPAEIEDVLLLHPDVVDAVVVGVPDDEWGQRIRAAVVVRPGGEITPDQLRAYVRERLRSSKTPDGIAFWAELPRTVTGKLLRREVVARLEPHIQPVAAS